MTMAHIWLPLTELIGTLGSRPGYGYEVTNKDDTKERVKLDYYWAFLVRGFGPPSEVAHYLLVASFAMDKWTRAACLMIPPLKIGKPDPFGEDAHTIDLDSWQDPMPSALQSLNIFPNDVGYTHITNYAYELKFATQNMYGNLSSDAFSSPYINLQMWNALEECLVYFAEQYDSEALKTYIGYAELKEKINQRKDEKKGDQ